MSYSSVANLGKRTSDDAHRERMILLVSDAVLDIKSRYLGESIRYKWALDSLNEAFRMASFIKDRDAQSKITRMRNWIRADLAKLGAKP